MSTINSQLKQTLRQHGYSVTRPRLIVFDLLDGHAPQTMHQLIQLAGDEIDRASLYRVISLFEEIGVAQRVYAGWKYTLELTDLFSHHHHHLTCLGCGTQIAVVEDSAIESLILRVAQQHQMVPVRHQLEIQGYCLHCQKSVAGV